MSEPIKLGVKLLHPDATVPKFMTDGAACFDLVATSSTVFLDADSCWYGAGLSFEIPEGYHVKLFSRSGHGFNRGITLCNSTGIIDSDFKGPIEVKLVRAQGFGASFPRVGERIAQAMLCKNVPTEIIEVQALSESARGTGGFGSTDNKKDK